MSVEEESDPSVIRETTTPDPSKSARTTSDLTLIWHRCDLRLHDNPLYSSVGIVSAENNADTGIDFAVPSLSVYIFNDKHFTPRPSTCNPTIWDAVTTGPHAARLLIEAVTDLRKSIHARGGELLIRTGDPIDILPKLARQVGATEIRWSEEPGIYERDVSRNVRERFIMSRDLSDVKIVTDIGYTLYHPNDLPQNAVQWQSLAHPKQKYSKKKRKAKRSSMPLSKTSKDPMDEFYDFMAKHLIVDVSAERLVGIPRIMGDYRRAVRTHTSVRSCLPTPEQLIQPPSIEHVEVGNIPTLEELTRYRLDDTRRPIMGMSKDTIENVVNAAIAHICIENENDSPNTNETDE
eukprot:8504500-Ditylum_brightwellii.AAC.1